MRKLFRALNIIEPRKDGAFVFSISKIWLWVALGLSVVAVLKFPEHAAGIVTALVGPAGLNYLGRRAGQIINKESPYGDSA